MGRRPLVLSLSKDWVSPSSVLRDFACSCGGTASFYGEGAGWGRGLSGLKSLIEMQIMEIHNGELFQTHPQKAWLYDFAKSPPVPDATKPAPWGHGFTKGVHRIKERGAARSLDLATVAWMVGCRKAWALRSGLPEIFTFGVARSPSNWSDQADQIKHQTLWAACSIYNLAGS